MQKEAILELSEQDLLTAALSEVNNLRLEIRNIIRIIIKITNHIYLII